MDKTLKGCCLGKQSLTLLEMYYIQIENDKIKVPSMSLEGYTYEWFMWWAMKTINLDMNC
jgi:hypothetical protein